MQIDPVIKKIDAIYSNRTCRGNGVDIPMRKVQEVYDFEGNLLGENDPYSFTIEQIRDALKKTGAPEEAFGQLCSSFGLIF